MSNEVDPISELAFDIARGQLISQKEDLRNLRNQASFSGAMTGLIATIFATLLGSQGLVVIEKNLSSMPSIWLFAICFCVSTALAIRVAVGWSDVTFDQSPKWILEASQNGHSQKEIRNCLAGEAEEFFEANEIVLGNVKSRMWGSLILSWTLIPIGLFILIEVRGAI